MTEHLKTVCRFVDPTNDVTGLSRYRKALTILFDPDRSEVKLKQIRVSGSDIIEADWTLGGYLKLPWQPYIDTIDGHTVSQKHLSILRTLYCARSYQHDSCSEWQMWQTTLGQITRYLRIVQYVFACTPYPLHVEHAS